MGLTPGVAPPPSRDTVRAIKAGLRAAELAPARWPSQLASYLQVALAIGLLCAWADRLDVLVAAAAALGGGVLVGTLTPIGARFVALSGTIVALVAVFVAFVVLAFADGRLFGDDPWIVLGVVGLAVLGLDWRFVPRLRARAVASGLLVVPLAADDERSVLLGALVWFAGLLVTLWLLERDSRAATLRPVPLTPASPARRTTPVDLVRALGVGVAIGLVAAMLLGDARCSLRDESPTRFRLPDVAVDGPPRALDPSLSDSGVLQGLDPSGRPFDFQIDGSGRRYVVDEDGERLYLDESDGSITLRDAEGDLRAEVGEDQVTVYDEDGRAQTYGRDADGGLWVEGADGERYTLDREEDGWVLRDGDGDVAARTDPRVSEDHLYARDADGNVLVPGEGGDGLVPVPRGSGAGGLLNGDDGSVVERDAEGDVVVRSPDGTTHTYDTDAEGRDRVRVERDGETRTFVYDESGDAVEITEYDEDGDVVDRYVYDPRGRAVDPDAGTAGGGPSRGSGDQAASGSTAPDDGSTDVPWLLIGAVALAVAALAALLVVWSRRDRGHAPRAPQTWAERLARRLDEEGRRRDRGRGRGETVVHHSDALTEGPLPDPRIATVGRMLSSALFGRRPPSSDEQRWAEQVVDEASASHPPPSRRDRRRTARDGRTRSSSGRPA